MTVGPYGNLPSDVRLDHRTKAPSGKDFSLSPPASSNAKSSEPSSNRATHDESEAARLYIHCELKFLPFPFSDLEQFGFEFSLADIPAAVARRKAPSLQGGWPTIHSHYLLHQMQAA